jgi:hypothetical protein
MSEAYRAKGMGMKVALGALSGFLALGLVEKAGAACTVAPQQRAPAADRFAAPDFAPAVFRPAHFQLANFAPAVEQGANAASIVGLWEFEVRASMDEGPFHQGDLLDWGLATWHDDGTEIQFSAGRPYDAGDVCMGVWRQTGRNKFHLNHIALGKDLGTGANFDGVTNIRADVTVDRSGDTFTGNYQITQYAGSPIDGTEFDQGTVQYQFLGTVTARRVLPN